MVLLLCQHEVLHLTHMVHASMETLLRFENWILNAKQSNQTWRVQEATVEILLLCGSAFSQIIFTASVHCWSSDGHYFVDCCDMVQFVLGKRQLAVSDITYVCGYNKGKLTIKWLLVLPSLECPQWPLPLVVPPPRAHDLPDMHTSLVSNHPGVG